MEQYPVGFFPTKKELIECLRNKVAGRVDGCVIPELEDFYAHDPWELPGLYRELSNIPSDGWDWYFICLSPYVAQNKESHIQRRTPSGYWHITSKWSHVEVQPNQTSIGSKRTLVFKEKDSSADQSTGTFTRTGWLMYEFHSNPNHPSGYSSKFKIPYVLCHLKRKPNQSLERSATIQRDSRVEDDYAVASQHGSAENTDQEIAYQETMATLPPIQTLDDNLPNHSLGGDLVPMQLNTHGNNQGDGSWETLIEEYCEDFHPASFFYL